MSNKLSRALNIGLQGTTLGTRFIFIFFLAKYLDPKSVGYYGLFAAAVGYSIYFVGFDFYTYVTREIITTPAEQRGRMLKGQAALSGALYLVLWPFMIAFLLHSGWPAELLWWFFPILLLEHFNQEMSRFLVAMSEQITASVILFIRQGSWGLLIVALMFWNFSARNLATVMLLWAVGGMAAAAIGVWKLFQLNIHGWRLPIDWAWVKRGIHVSLAFLLSTLALRGMQTLDRYWLEALGSVEMVAAYIVLLGIAGTLLAFLDAGVFAFAYPALITLIQKNELSAVKEKILQMLLQTVALSAAFAVGSWLVLSPLLDWIGNPVYMKYQHWYPWLLLAMVLNAISMVPHYALYASGQDKHIVYSHIGCIFIFGVAVLLLRSSFGALAIPLSLNIAFAFILAWKAIAFWPSYNKNTSTIPSSQVAAGKA